MRLLAEALLLLNIVLFLKTVFKNVFSIQMCNMYYYCYNKHFNLKNKLGCCFLGFFYIRFETGVLLEKSDKKCATSLVISDNEMYTQIRLCFSCSNECTTVECKSLCTHTFFFNGKRRKHDSVLSTKNIIPWCWGGFMDTSCNVTSIQNTPTLTKKSFIIYHNEGRSVKPNARNVDAIN